MRLPFRSLVLTACLLSPIAACAQDQADALSNAEIEQLREANLFPDQRVLVFLQFLQDRVTRIDKLVAKARHAGREQDIHDLLEEFSSIANEFEDNLSEYDDAHRDVRKPLPKLLKAMDTWETDLKKAPADDEYNVAKTIALEAIIDLRDQANETFTNEKAWFLAHPPPKEPGNNNSPVHPG